MFVLVRDGMSVMGGTIKFRLLTGYAQSAGAGKRWYHYLTGRDRYRLISDDDCIGHKWNACDVGDYSCWIIVQGWGLWVCGEKMLRLYEGEG
jgi:hypothetical protein